MSSRQLRYNGRCRGSAAGVETCHGHGSFNAGMVSCWQLATSSVGCEVCEEFLELAPCFNCRSTSFQLPQKFSHTEQPCSKSGYIPCAVTAWICEQPCSGFGPLLTFFGRCLLMLFLGFSGCSSWSAFEPRAVHVALPHRCNHDWCIQLPYHTATGIGALAVSHGSEPAMPGNSKWVVHDCGKPLPQGRERRPGKTVKWSITFHKEAISFTTDRQFSWR